MNQISFNIELDSAKACQALRAFLNVLDPADASQVGDDTTRASSSAERAQSSADEKCEYEGKIQSPKGVIDDLTAKIFEKDEEIKSLRQRLDEFIPNFTNQDDIKYLKISDDRLVLTNDNKAAYQAVEVKGRVGFRFNVDTGLCKDACRDRENIIKPFCNIESQSEEADGIENIEPGWGKWDDSPQLTLKVVEKAKVKLIKL